MSTDAAERRTDALLAAASALVAAALVGVEYARHFQLAWMYEHSAYGDAARELLAGGRLATRFVEPMELAWLEAHGMASPPWPLTFRFPLYLVALAGAFATFGASDGVEVGVNAALLGALAALTYYTARALAPGRRAVAVVASLAVATNPTLWRQFAQWGYGADLLYAVTLGGLLLGVCRALRRDDEARGAFAGLGAVAALAYYARFSFMVALPGVLAGLWLVAGPHRRRRVAAFAGAFFALVLPFYVYRQVTLGGVQTLTFTGNLAHLGGAAPWLEYRTLDLGAFLRAHGAEVARKWALNLCGHLVWLVGAFGYELLTPFAVTGALTEPDDAAPARRVYVTVGALTLAAQWVVFSLLRVEAGGRYFLWIAPALVALGVDTFTTLVSRRAGRHARAWLAASLAFAVAFVALRAGQGVRPTTQPAWARESPRDRDFPRLARAIPRDAWVVSNVGVHLAWYTGRAAVDLPATPAELVAMVRRHRIRYVFIAPWPQGELGNRPAWMAYMAAPDWRQRLGAELGYTRVRSVRDAVLLDADGPAR